MIPELGNFALMLALGLAVVQAVFPIAGAWRGDRAWMALGRSAARGQCAFVLFAFGCLVHSFVVNDFSVAYVVANSNSELPLQFRVAAVWGGHEGSLLLWTLILALWTLAASVFSRNLPDAMLARALGVMGLVSVGFLGFLLFTSDPFLRTLPAAPDGRDLNPLLQDLGMIAHPPLLYMGYVGFSVAFAFAIAALLEGQPDAAWARWSRPWTMVAWSFLTLGIGLGSFWAYYELGWGGWWFWDAVENASFMPWLVGTALLHSLIVTEKRGSFKSWTVLLAIITFSLSLLGTFLVRSGVLTSVHAFASDPLRGIFILGFLAIVIGASLLLFAWRAPKIGAGGQFALLSRESLLLANNVLLVTAAATVLLGTLYPLLLDALDLGKISVGPPYFETVFPAVMLPLLVLLAVGPFVHWKSAHWPDLVRTLRPIAIANVVLAASLLLWSTLSPMSVLGLVAASWILLAMGWHLLQRLRQRPSRKLSWSKLALQPRSYWGMLLAHAGIGVFVIGVTLVKGTETSVDLRMQLGESTVVAGYTFRFADLQHVEGPNYTAVRAKFEVSRGAGQVTSMLPEKRRYRLQESPMTEAAIDRSLSRDLYLALGEQVNATTWIVRLQHKPFVGWIWGGCLLMAAGGFMAASDRRYRLAAVAPALANTGARGVAPL